MTVKTNPLIMVVDEAARFQGRVKRLFDEAQSRSGLSNLESLVLAAVTEADIPPTVPQIGRSLGHPRQVIQRAANELIAAGLVEKLPNPHHKRAALLKATDKGMKLEHQATEKALAVANTFLNNIDETKCARVAQDLRDLRQAIEAYARRRDIS